MTSKRIKEHKGIHDEVISKEYFVDVFNRLVKKNNDMKKWAKEAESLKKTIGKKNTHLRQK